MRELTGMGKGFGMLIYLCLVALLGAIVAYAVKREKQKSVPPQKPPEDKPSFVKELSERLKDPYKPTGR